LNQYLRQKVNRKRSFSRIELLIKTTQNLQKPYEYFITSTMSTPNDLKNNHAPNESDRLCHVSDDWAGYHAGHLPLGGERRLLHAMVGLYNVSVWFNP
jgi:hypothetical protein